MLKALLKKQFLELGTFYFQNKKTGKKRSKAGVVGLIILFAFLFIFLGVTFFGVSYMLAEALVPIGLTWLFITLVSCLAIALGTFGSVFNTYAGLYHAKDNELLLSMPIPPSKIIFVRMTGVFILGLVFEALVIVPALVAYFIVGNPSVLAVIFSVLLIFVIAFFVLALTCFLGFIIALISSKLKNKSVITVILSLLFLAVYYYVCMNFSNYLNEIIENSIMVGETVKNAAYPLYLLGRAGEGSATAMLAVTVIVGILFALTYFILSRTFMRIATKKDSSAKVVYKEKTVKVAGVGKALFSRELKRFTSSATYMMNCALGSVFMIAGAVAAIIFASDIRGALEMFDIGDFVPVIIVAVACMIASMNDITAPSVSLEAKTLWILKSMPVETEKVFAAKQYLQLVITVPPALFLTVALAVVFKVDVASIIIMAVLVTVFIMFSAAAGLAIGLKKPNLDWTNETIPIKQGLPVVICIFGGWVVSLIMGFGGYFAVKYISSYYVLIIELVVFALLSRLVNTWLRGKGVKIFEEL